MTCVYICRCHSPRAQGARTAAGLTEWQIAEDINTEIARTLESCGVNCEILERTLPWRINTINQFAGRDDLAVEVHCNASPNPGAHGYSALAYYRSKPAIGLACDILDSLDSLAGVLTHNSRPRMDTLNLVDANRQMIGTDREYSTKRQAFCSQTKCISVLVECLFLTNPREAALIAMRKNRVLIGNAIAGGIVDYLDR